MEANVTGGTEQTKNNHYIQNSIEYSIWFLAFMLVEAFANTRVGAVFGNDKVELFYGVFIIFTAIGFLLYGKIWNTINNQQIIRIGILFCMITVGIFSLINLGIVVVVGAMCSLLSFGLVGARIMYKLAIHISSCKKPGTILGVAMAGSIFMQFIVQTMISSTAALVICYELLLLLVLAFEFFTMPKTLKISEGDVKLNDRSDTNGKRIVYVVATVIMTVILSLNDAYLVDLSAHTNTVELFSGVRLFYCLSLILAGFIYDYNNANYFNVIVACGMMLSTVAYAFIGSFGDLNVNMSIMYFYCGFYVMFLTIHFIKEASFEEDKSLQHSIPGLGRVTRCLTTALVTFIMIASNNAVSVQMMIIISSIMSIILVFLLASNDILIVHRQGKRIAESLDVAKTKGPTVLQKEQWDYFVDRYEFTPRECDVLDKLIHTENNLQEIAETLFISKRVVQRHITSIYEKTGRTTRIGLLQLYVELIQKNKET